MAQPMENIRVLDFTRVLSGPFATQILADLGAEVLKIEPLQGDETRTWPPTLENGESGYFGILNRNKKSITLNLRDKRGQEIAAKLAAMSDIVMENYTPGVADKLNIDYQSLSRNNPGLIYCSLSGFGQYGPYRTRKAYDPIIQGITGIMSLTGEKDGPPAKVGVPITDLFAALYAVISIQASLLYKKETGIGQYIDVAMYDSVISILTSMAAEYFATGVAPGRWGLDHAQRVPARAFMARDGKYVQVTATSEPMYAEFCKILNLPELINDERFNTNLKRLKNRDILMPILEKKMLTGDSGDWMGLFEGAGLPCGLICDLKEVFEDPHLAAREMVLNIENPVAGLTRMLGFPYKFSLTKPVVHSCPPFLGEHSREVLTNLLHYSEEKINALRADGVI